MSVATLNPTTTVNFKSLHEVASRNLQELRAAEQTEQVRAAALRIEQFLIDISDNCHPTMDIPITVR